MRQSELTAEIKACAQKIANELPERLLKGDKVRHKLGYTRRSRAKQVEVIEQSYDQLDGKWRQWLEVARRFEHKARAQDRLDLRHTIIVAFADQQARNEANSKPDLSFYGMLRIASHCVADYWREINKATVKVCVLNGLPTIPDHKCSFVGKPSKCSQCPFLAVRPIESLNTELEDTEGNRVELIDTLADDSVDIEAWAERSTWELGYPKRLVEIAYKLDWGKNLTATDSQYLWRYRKRAQKGLI